MLYRRDAMLRLGSVGCGAAFAATTDGDGANSGTGGKEVGSLLHFFVHVGRTTAAGYVGHEAGCARRHPQSFQGDCHDSVWNHAQRSNATNGPSGRQAGHYSLADAFDHGPRCVGVSYDDWPSDESAEDISV